jgi:hypothetical protein
MTVNTKPVTEQVYDLLLNSPPLSREEIIRKIGVKKTTTSSAIDRLLSRRQIAHSGAKYHHVYFVSTKREPVERHGPPRYVAGITPQLKRDPFEHMNLAMEYRKISQQS